MITQALLTFMHGLAGTMFGALHDLLPSPPSFVTDANTALATVVSSVAAPIRDFVPIGPVLVAGAAMLALSMALGLVRLARRVVSLMTGGGGS